MLTFLTVGFLGKRTFCFWKELLDGQEFVTAKEIMALELKAHDVSNTCIVFKGSSWAEAQGAECLPSM